MKYYARFLILCDYVPVAFIRFYDNKELCIGFLNEL